MFLALGLIGVKLHNSFNEENLLVDAIQLIINTLPKFHDFPSLFWVESDSLIDCSSVLPWSYGTDIYQYKLFLSSMYRKEILVS